MNFECQLTEMHLCNYRDNQLADQQRQDTKLHLASCPKCREALHRLQSLVSDIQKWQGPAAPDSNAKTLFPPPPLAQEINVEKTPPETPPVNQPLRLEPIPSSSPHQESAAVPESPVPVSTSASTAPPQQETTSGAAKSNPPEPKVLPHVTLSPKPLEPKPVSRATLPAKPQEPDALTRKASIRIGDEIASPLPERQDGIFGLRLFALLGFGMLVGGAGFLVGRYQGVPTNPLLTAQLKTETTPQSPLLPTVSEQPIPLYENLRTQMMPPEPPPEEPKKPVVVEPPPTAPAAEVKSATEETPIPILGTPEGWKAYVVQNAKSLEYLLAALPGGYEAPKNLDFNQLNLLVLAPQTTELATPVIEAPEPMKMESMVRVQYAQRSRQVTDGPPGALFISLPKSTLPILFERLQ